MKQETRSYSYGNIDLFLQSKALTNRRRAMFELECTLLTLMLKHVIRESSRSINSYTNNRERKRVGSNSKHISPAYKND